MYLVLTILYKTILQVSSGKMFYAKNDKYCNDICSVDLKLKN